MRKGLHAHYGDDSVGMGGTFNVAKGSIKAHVMPGFSETPIESDADVDAWLKFFDMHAPLTCLSCFISHDPGLDLRVEHTHFFR